MYANRISKRLRVSFEYLINGKENKSILKTNKEILIMLNKINEQFNEKNSKMLD